MKSHGTNECEKKGSFEERLSKHVSIIREELNFYICINKWYERARTTIMGLLVAEAARFIFCS